MKRTILLSAVGLLIVGSNTNADAGQTRRLELRVAGMACQGCASHVNKGVGKLKGVVSVKADPKKQLVVVIYKPARTTTAKILRTIIALGYVIGDKDPPAVYGKGADVKLLSKKGEDVRVTRHLARGKVTIVDFYADWCRPCKALDRRLAARVRVNKTRIAVRKVNIVTWATPAAKRYLRNVKGLPYIRIYDQRGRLIVKLAQDNVEKLDYYLVKLLGSSYRKPR